MNVTMDDLLKLIGSKEIEISVLRGQLAQAQEQNRTLADQLTKAASDYETMAAAYAALQAAARLPSANEA